MADEVTNETTNSVEATQTGASETTASPSSTTETSQAASEADPLDGGTALSDAKGETDAAGEGEAAAGEAEGGEEGGEAKGDEAASLTGAPEGDYELALPEGMVLDVAALEAVAPVAKELNVSNAGLSKLASVYAEKVLPGVTKSVLDGVTQQVVAARAGWDADTTAAISGGKDADGNAVAPDPVYAGKPKDAVLATAAKALDRFGGSTQFPGAKADGSPGTFREFLQSTGLGNHPAMVRFAFLAGSAISEDSSFERSGGIPNTPKSREEKYYPNMTT